MSNKQFARGIFADFGTVENPFQSPNGMEENLRLIDDHLALTTVKAPTSRQTWFPSDELDGDAQIFTDGTYATLNGGVWRIYPARNGIRATLKNLTDGWVNTGSSWERNSVVSAAAMAAAAAPLLAPFVDEAEAARDQAVDARDQAIDAANLVQASSATIWCRTYDTPPGNLTAFTSPDDTPAVVTDDPDPLLRGNYRALGGGWVKTALQAANTSDVERVEATAQEALQAAMAVPVVTAEEEDIAVIRDALRRVGLRLKADAVTEAHGVRLTGLADTDSPFEAGAFKILKGLTEATVGTTRYRVVQNDDWFVAYVDTGNRIAFGIRWSGHVFIGSLQGYVTTAQFTELVGRVTALEAKSGSGSTASTRAPLPAYVEGSTVRMFDSDGSDQVALDLTDLVTGIANPRIRIEGRAAVALTNRGYFGAQGPQAVSIKRLPDGSHLVVDPTERICYVVPTVGQSNSVGSRGVPADIPVLLSEEYGNSLMMLDGPPDNGVRLTYGYQVFDPAQAPRLVPMKSMLRKTATTPEGYGLGVTHVEGMGFRLAYEFRKTFGFDPFMVMFTAGMGGMLYTELKKGTRAHANMLAAIQHIKTLVEPMGYRVVVPYVAIVHGESDSNRKTYQQGIMEWQVDMDADIRAITGQTAAIPCICSQASTFGSLVPDRQILGASASAMGRVIWGVYSTYLACKSRTTHHMAGAYYPLEFSDDYLHLSKYGHAMNGEYLALTAMATVFGTKTHGAIMPRNVAFDGDRTVTIEFDVPCAPLVRDESIVDPGAWGFELFDGDGWSMQHPDYHPGVTITPELVDGTTIRLVCSAPIPAGPQRSVGYALQGWPAPKQPGQGSRGQLRDSSPEKSILNDQPLYRWMPHFLELF